MRIFICGTTCVGKTSLIEELKKLNKFKNYEVVPSARQKIIDLGLSHTQESNDETQTIYFDHYLEYYDKYNIIFDRSLIDVITFSEWLVNEDKVADFTYYNQLSHFMILDKRIDDYYFFIKPEFPLINDGFRTITEEMRQDISFRMERILKYLEIDYFYLSGTVQERLNQVQQVLDKQF